MKRSKKSLFNAILVGFLSASLMMPTSAYALTLENSETINKNVEDGLYVGGNDVTVTVNGNVSDERVDKEGDGGLVADASKVTVNGDVNTNINNWRGDVTVTGSVKTKVNDDSVYSGVSTSSGSTTIEKDVTVDTDKGGSAVEIIAKSRDNTVSKANVSINGNVSIKSSGSTGVDTDTGYDENGNKYPDEIYFYDPTGVDVGTRGNADVKAKIEGKIEATSKGVATGIGVSTRGITSDDNSDSKAKINITSGSVTAIGSKEIDESFTGEFNNSESNGIYIGNGQDVDSEINIVVKGDLSSEIGIGINNKNDKTTKAENNIVVDGTINSTEGNSAVYIFNQNENDNTLNLTAWKVNSDTTNSVIVKKMIDTEKDGVRTRTKVMDEEASKKLSANINYIIRHEGTITLDGTRTITSYNGDSYETAHENEKLTIHVKVDDDKKYRVDRVEGGTATATKNADGSWTLIVPKNGGVDIRAVLVAIEQKESGGSSSSSSSGSGSSSGGSSSTRPGASNAASGMTTTTTDGATVQSNVAKSGNSTTTAASVRIGTTTANVVSTVSEQNGTKVTFQNATGNLAGASFKSAGQVSADGATLVKEDGTTAKMAVGTLLAIENADGTSVGCFVDATGKIIATGSYEVYYMLGTDGMLHAHFVNSQGYFLTGIQVINGQTVTFNATGEMVSVQ